MNIYSRRSPSLGTILFFLASALSGLGQHVQPPGFPSNIQLGGVVQGDAAIGALGNRLPEVAAFYRKSPDELRALFRSDHSLKADPQGRLFYACDGLVATGSSASAPVAESITPIDNPPFSTNDTFILHSRPGANRVIYLDFNGHTDTSANPLGKWKAGAAEPAFDLDGDTNTWTSTECNRIIYIWQRVSEDYSMYDIDVTTEDPGIEALRKSNSSDQIYGVRVVIGGSSFDWYGSGVGGVAYVGSFDWNTDTPCWVFAQTQNNQEKSIAEAASHEAGHTLGLSHDGTTTGSPYYSGQGNWAPIMGVGYSKKIVQWSKGEYTDANNKQDDLSVMTNNGAVYRTDDHGNSTAAATVLSTGSTNGVIERNTDLDFFRFTAAGGSATISVNRAPRDSNLRLQVILYDSLGVPILTNTPADSSTSGTQSSVTTKTLVAGNYYVSVAGVGNGDPLTTGYSDYASLGQYTVTVTGTAPPGPLWLPTVAGTYSWTNQSNWLGAPPNAVEIIALINNNIGGNQTINLPTAIMLGTLTLGDQDDTHTFTLQPAGGSLTFNNGSSSAGLNKLSGLDDVIAVPVTLVSNLTVNHSAIGTLTLAGAIGGAGGSLTKTGPGTTALAGTNSYGGITTVGEGVLRLHNTNALPGGNLTLDGGVLGLGNGDFTNRTVGTGASQVRWTGDGGFAAYGASRAVKFSAGSINWTDFIGNGNTLILGAEDSDATLLWQQAFSLAGSTRTIQVNDGSAAIDAKLTGSFAGGNAGTYVNHFNKTGGGTLAITVQPTYRGDTTISGGTLMLGDGTGSSGGVSLNTSNVVVSGGATLALNRTDTLTQGTSALPVAISGEGEFAQVGSGTTVFTLSNSYAGPTTITGGMLQLGAGGTGGSIANSTMITVSSGATFAVNRSDTVTQGVEFTNSITGDGEFAQIGSGTTVFTLSNNYAGPTTISGGTLQLGAGGAGGSIANSTMITVSSGATFAVNRSDMVTQGVEFTNSITGGGGFAQIGSGTTVLTLANTFTGLVSIASGTLALDNLNAVANASGITLAGGARLSPNLSNQVINAAITLGSVGTTATINAPAAAGSGTAAVPLTLNGAIGGAGNLTLNGNNAANAYSTIILNAAGSYQGSTLMTTLNSTAGNLNTEIFVKLGINNALPRTTVLTLDGGNGAGTGFGRYCELNLNGNNQTLAGLTNVPGRTLRVQRIVNNSATASTLTVSNHADHTFSGQLGWQAGQFGSSAYNNFGLTKSGNGVLNLTGTNAYAGNTTVNGGTLKVLLPRFNTNSTVSVSAGAVLRLDFAETNAVGAFYTNGVALPAGVYNASNVAPFLQGPGSLGIASIGPGGPATLTNHYNPATLTLTLSWPGGQNWRLEMQTNSLSNGLGTNWVDVTPGTASSTNIAVDPVRPAAFYRLAHP